ncbi:peptide chain release factor family protein [Cellulomonas denverensis]|uniref:peptide chain release factor family protein n=1 Tax=Cellulomonas denverensis TaxID=264297 RepID=UPI0035E8A6D9
MTDRAPILTVTIRDCEVQTFRACGKGGQHQNKTDSGVRVIHHPSGARGESREERSQRQNKRAAFERMAHSPAFRYWVAVQTGRRKSDEQLLAEIEAELNDPAVTRTEVRGPSGWEVVA